MLTAVIIAVVVHVESFVMLIAANTLLFVVLLRSLRSMFIDVIHHDVDVFVVGNVAIGIGVINSVIVLS